MAKQFTHTDLLGRSLAEGDVVVTCHHNCLEVCTITKLHEKQIRVHRVLSETKPVWRKDPVGHLKYPSQLVKVDNADATYYLLTKG